MIVAHQHADGAGSRRVLDEAVGILVGCRRCTPEQAFDEIAAAVKETGVGLGQLTAGLVGLASGSTDIVETRAEVVERWGGLFADRAVGV
jgi:hypothetical protein